MYICVIVSTVDVNDCIFCANEQQKVYIYHGVPVFEKVEQTLIVGEIVILRYKRLRVLEYVSHLLNS